MLNQLLADLLRNTKATTVTDESVTYEWHPESSKLVITRPYRRLTGDEVRHINDLLGFMGKHGTRKSARVVDRARGNRYGYEWQFPRKRDAAPEMEALL